MVIWQALHRRYHTVHFAWFLPPKRDFCPDNSKVDILCPKLEAWYVKYNYTLLCLNTMWNCHYVDLPVPYITGLNCNTIFEDSSIILDPEKSSSLLLPKWNWLSNWLFVSDNTYTLNSSIDSNQKVDESEIQVLRMD